jgi:hypothetical protein
MQDLTPFPAFPSSAASQLRVVGYAALFTSSLLFYASFSPSVHHISTSGPRAGRHSQRELTPSLQAGPILTTNGPAPALDQDCRSVVDRKNIFNTPWVRLIWLTAFLSSTFIHPLASPPPVAVGAPRVPKLAWKLVFWAERARMMMVQSFPAALIVYEPRRMQFFEHGEDEEWRGPPAG